MLEKSLATLEFFKVRAQIAKFAASGLGQNRLEELSPYTLCTEAEQELEAVDEAFVCIQRFGQPAFGGISDIRDALKRAQLGSVLNIEQLLAIRRCIEGTANLKQYIRNAVGQYETAEGLGTSNVFPHVRELSEALFDARRLELEIARIILDDATISDHASPELRQLRIERRTAEARARKILEDLLRKEARHLQEPVIALRGQSLCLPVRVDAKHQIPGIVRDTSASGSTVYVEPQAVLEQGEKVRELLVREEREIEKILQKLSALVAEVADELRENCQLLSNLDAWFAKARYALKHHCSKPKMNSDGYWLLRSARHPLLDEKQAVPIDLELGREYRMLMITGPNTGGKTVTLKTMGLLTLMAMAGCFIHANENSEIAFCRTIFADIGDEQSIEQSLSTFSSHLKNMIHMLQQVHEQDLVLLDELGAGTDPGEGAALAVAILETLAECGARVVATTHHAELKAFAFREPAAINASMEFDVQSLQPTYRLLIGVPGRSNAFAIARRLGLPEKIIERASRYISNEQEEMDRLIGEMEKARKQHLEALAAAEEARNKAQSLEEQYQRALVEWEEASSRKEEELLQEAERVLVNARQTAERVIQELRRERKDWKDHEFVELRKSLEEALPTRKNIQRAKSGNKKAIAVGQAVRVLSLGQKAEVIELSGQYATVQMGPLRSKIDVRDLEPIEGASKPTVQGVRVKGGESIRMEIDVRGETVEDALLRIDRHLDAAMLQGLGRIVIIHGKGTGALRTAIRQHLKHHKAVKSFASGSLGEGGDGVTVVSVQV
ncbi:endonuclease MutS2 [Alicyclobacillus tolerans]|uniref:endonuclease MutS2 n=1 Tax=Alicyclobacillus tolerans TaxID=90970 RepID=UPI003B7B21F1